MPGKHIKEIASDSRLTTLSLNKDEARRCNRLPVLLDLHHIIRIRLMPNTVRQHPITRQSGAQMSQQGNLLVRKTRDCE